MKIFISWSGPAAHEMATFLQVWLVKVIQALDPFVSSESIESGARWDAEIASQLEDTGEAIVIVTSRNQNEPWLNFEAGALAKATDSRVRPLLIDLTPTDFSGPISSFQATRASDRPSVVKMLKEINFRCERKLADAILEQIIEREWPEFEKKLAEVIATEQAAGRKPPGRGTPEIVAEILDRVRAIERETVDQRSQFINLAEFLTNPGVGFWVQSDSDLRPNAHSRRAWTAEQQERLLAEEAERRVLEKQVKDMTNALVGRTFEADSSDGKYVRGRAIDVLTRGSGIYVRLETDSGRSQVVPVTQIREVDGTLSD